MENSDNFDESSKALLKRLYKDYISNRIKAIFAAVICMVVAAALTAVMAWMMQPVLDEIFVNQNNDLLMPIAIGVFVISFIKGATVYAQTVIMNSIAQKSGCDIQVDMFKHLLDADIAFFSNTSSGSLLSRFTNDNLIIRRNISQILINIIKEPLTLIFLVGVMFYQNFHLAIITFFVFPMAIFPVIWLGKKMRGLSEITQENVGRLTSALEDAFQGIRVVKAYGQETSEIERTEKIINKSFKYYMKGARISSASSPIMETLAGVAIAAVIAYGGSQVLKGETTPGAFFSFMTALIMAYRPMKSISKLNVHLQDMLAAVKRHYKIVDTQPTIQDLEGANNLKCDDPTIRFEGVNFNYAHDKEILKDLTFDVPAGKRVALVGSSGAGKSTIMNMILRFYDPNSGKITIGGEDIKYATLKSLRQSMAIVTQETTLFDDTIRVNICYGLENTDEEAMISAAKAAAADEFIQSLPNGYDTNIGQAGVRLSGGQRQRIAIARAMLRNSPILLLDEATSSLDTISEQKIQMALENLMKNRTSLVIAHRLSTIQNADIIYVIDAGKIIESGKHDELLEKRGAYCDLYNRQFSGEIKKDEADKE